MSDDPLDIPDFLRRTPGERQVAWDIKPAKEKPEARHPWHLPRNMDAACWEMVREAERAKEARKQAGLAALRQWKLENRR